MSRMITAFRHLEEYVGVTCVLRSRLFWQDDQRILWEGVSSLTKQELQVSVMPAY